MYLLDVVPGTSIKFKLKASYHTVYWCLRRAAGTRGHARAPCALEIVGLVSDLPEDLPVCLHGYRSRRGRRDDHGKVLPVGGLSKLFVYIAYQFK